MGVRACVKIEAGQLGANAFTEEEILRFPKKAVAVGMEERMSG